jgi:hypothetical protein
VSLGEPMPLRLKKDFNHRIVMGNLVIPPGGIKRSTWHGNKRFTSTVCCGQAQALEVAFRSAHDDAFNPKTAQQFLLSPGDMFQIPTRNEYQLENHSKVSDCILSYTLIYKCRRLGTDKEEGGSDTETEDESNFGGKGETLRLEQAAKESDDEAPEDLRWEPEFESESEEPNTCWQAKTKPRSP